MIGLTWFFRRAGVRTVHRSRTAGEHLCRSKVVVRRRRWRRNSIRVEAEDIERAEVVGGNVSFQVRWNPRIHDPDVAEDYTAVETRLFPVARLITVSAIVRRTTWPPVRQPQLRLARDEKELKGIRGAPRLRTPSA